MKSSITTQNFEQKARLVHGDKYCYNLVEYKQSKIKVKIICPIHGVIQQYPHVHLKGFGCNKCAHKRYGEKTKYSNQQYKKLMADKHNNKYDYSLLNYTKRKDKIIVICPIHGSFQITRRYHTVGGGCPSCKIKSKGQEKIQNYLTSLNIKFVTNKRFPQCRFKDMLPFDFYLPDFNTLIQYDGKQHFGPQKFHKHCDDPVKRFQDLQVRDTIKTSFCLSNNTPLLRIPYTDFDNIQSIISSFLAK